MELTEKVELKNEKGEVYFTLEYLPKKKQLYTTWFGWMPMNVVLTGIEQQLIWIETYNGNENCDLLINDCTKVEGAWSDLIPEMEKSGLMKRWENVSTPIKYNANIQNDNIFNNVSADVFAEDPQTSRYAKTYIFKSIEEAEKWFEKM